MRSENNWKLSRRATTVIFHFTAWICFALLMLSFANSNESQTESAGRQYFSSSSIQFLLFYISLFYLNKQFLFPKLFLRKNYLAYFSILALLVIATIYLKPFDRLMNPNGHQQIARREPPPPPRFPDQPAPGQGPRSAPAFDVVSLVLFGIVFSISSAAELVKRWQETEQKILRAEKDKSQAELEFLKAQVNPHFLFNTLNNIYSLAVAKSDSTPDAILQLSNMMRYLTDEAANDYVDLSDELNYVRDYIELQRLRVGSKTQIQFLQEGDPTGKKIAPLLLISFVENAFKYGVSNSQASTVLIHSTIANNELEFKTRNKIFSAAEQTERKGIGIENVSQRLRYLYPERHKLTIVNSAESFEVDLDIELK